MRTRTATFCAVVERYQGGLFTLCLRMLGNEEDARDALQEGLLKAFEHLDQFQRRAGLGTWLYTIVRRVCYDELRRRRRRPVPHDPQDWVWAVPRPPDATDISERLVLRQALRGALAALPPSHREVLALRSLVGLSSVEAARWLRLPDGTVRSRLHRACATLRRTLDVSACGWQAPMGRPNGAPPTGGRRPGTAPGRSGPAPRNRSPVPAGRQ